MMADMPSFEEAKRISATWPEVSESTSYGTPSLKVKGKSFCRMWSEREHDRDDVHDTDVLVVFCDLDEKRALIDSSEGVLFSTPHYEGYGAMLIRLADVTLDDLTDYLEDSYRLKAPPAVLRRFDETTAD
jgi:hypothetical protein